MKEWFKARTVWGAAFMSLTDSEAGRLAKALWSYTMTGEPPELSGNERGIFAMLQMTLDQDDEFIADLSAKRSAAGKRGARQKLANQANARDAEAKQANANNKSQSQNQNQIDINDDDDDNSRTRVADAFLHAFGRNPTPGEASRILRTAALLGAATDMVVLAVEIAAENGAENPAAYVKTILAEWHDEHVTNMEEYEDYKFMADAAAGRNDFWSEDAAEKLDAAREERKKKHGRRDTA